jgi:4-hydroxybenzoate polyprenyltransferase
MHPSIRAWAQLVRVPNTLTSCADVIAGFAIAAGAWVQINERAVSVAGPALLAACAGSIALYWAGMVLNDVHDVEADRKQRRNGPLVDGRIQIGTARSAGWLLLMAGIALACLSAYLVPKESEGNRGPMLTLATSIVLAGSIVAYDSRLKATRFGPILMGLCRGLNMLIGVFLGASIVWPIGNEWSSLWAVIGGHTAYVIGITLAARREGFMQQSKLRLAWSWGVSMLGVVVIGTCCWWSLPRPFYLDPISWFPGLIAILMFPWIRRVYVSIASPGVGTLVPAIKQAILSIIFLDAALTLQFAGNTLGLLVCGLAIPTFLLSRVFRVT